MDEDLRPIFRLSPLEQLASEEDEVDGSAVASLASFPREDVLGPGAEILILAFLCGLRDESLTLLFEMLFFTSSKAWHQEGALLVMSSNIYVRFGTCT